MTKRKIIVRSLDVSILIVVTAVLLAWTTDEWKSKESAAMRAVSTELPGGTVRPELIRRGARVVLPNVQWHDGVRTIVLLASATCPACNDGIAFYKHLGDYVRDLPEMRFVIAAVDDMETVKTWADTHGVRHDVVVEMRDAISHGFTLTPTLLVMDDDGVVTDVLLGRLSKFEESMLWGRLRRPRSVAPLSNARYPEEIGGAEFRDLVSRNRERLVVIDVRSRSEYRPRRIGQGAINIPLDELAIRGPVELLGRSIPDTVVVDCTVIHWAQCRRAGRILEHIGVENPSLLLP